MFRPFFLNNRFSSNNKLPVMIIHFQGLIGIIKENIDISGNNRYNGPQDQYSYYLRNDFKKQLKRISRSFLIIVILESNDNANKSMVNYIVK